MACPMPRAAPVTRLTLPVRSDLISMTPRGSDDRGTRSSQKPRTWILEQTRERLEEPRRRRPVHDPVVEGEAQRHSLAGRELLMRHHGLGLNPSHAQDGALGQVDDRREY